MNKKFISIIAFTGLAFILISATVDLDNLFNYEDQDIPDYIAKDNTSTNPIDDKIATLGRVLFYDKNLSSNNTIACASCHIQEHAFSDLAVQSIGLDGGFTGRHSMRLINARFADETHFFWDERANTLEAQTTQPIQDHIEMGYSGTNGDPDINDLIIELEAINYYQQLFTFAYGDVEISEEKMQLALAQFVRSIQSFDSRYDQGREQVANGNLPFPNYTTEENQGKNIFLAPPNNGGAGCAGCHRPPEFDIDPAALNNGIIGIAGDPTGIDLTNTRSPSLRDLVKPNGTLNGPLMHDGSLTSLLDVVNHYDQIPNDPTNTNLDPRLLGPGGQPLNLNLSEDEKQALIAFLETLSGNDVYTNEKWSNPFEEDGSIEIIGGDLGINEIDVSPQIMIAPNPATQYIEISAVGNFHISIFNYLGQLVLQSDMTNNTTIDISLFSLGLYIVQFEDVSTAKIYTKKIIKE